MDFKKNELINEVLTKNFETFALTLDTCDFVPEKFLKKTHKYLFKNMKKQFKNVDKEYNQHIREINRKQKQLKKHGHKSLLYRFCCWLKYRKMKRKHRLLCYNQQKNIEIKDYVIEKDFTV